MPATDTRLKRIRALLDRAQRTDTSPVEAENAREMAMRLMVEHNIDQAMLDAAADETATDEIDTATVAMYRPYTFEKGELLSAIGWVFGCDSSARGVTGQHSIQSITLYGYRSDMERAQLLYTSLLMQATNEMARTPTPVGHNRVTFLRDFLYGFTVSVVNRLRQLQQAAAEQYDTAHAAEAAGGDNAPVSVALVLADRRKRVHDYFEAQTQGLPVAEPVERDGIGTYAGHVAGQRADLGTGPTVTGGPARQDTLTLGAPAPVLPDWLTRDHWAALADLAMQGSQPCAAEMGATPALHLEVVRAVVSYYRDHGREHDTVSALRRAACGHARAVVSGDPGRVNELAAAVLAELHDRIELWASKRRAR